MIKKYFIKILYFLFLKSKKLRTIYGYQKCFPVFFFKKNKKLFLKTIVKRVFKLYFHKILEKNRLTLKSCDNIIFTLILRFYIVHTKTILYLY